MWLLMLTGCLQTIRFPPDLWVWESADTGLNGPTAEPEPVLPSVAGVTGGCDADGAAWSWRVRTAGQVGVGSLDTFRVADDAHEEHLLWIEASDPAGTWDELAVGPLPDGVDPAVQQTNVDSRFDCELDAETLTHLVRIRDVRGELLDCVVWGADASAAFARIQDTDPELSALGCRLILLEDR